METKTSRLLLTYCVISTTLLLAAALYFAFWGLGHAKIDRIEAHRVDIIEPDGTLRLAMTDAAMSPPILIKGHAMPSHVGNRAGMIFYNNEASENGGLVIGGEKRKDGTTFSSGHLSFDGYEQDQSMTLDSVQDDRDRWTRFQILDVPQYSVAEQFQYESTIANLPAAERKAKLKAWITQHGRAITRLSLGRGISAEGADTSVSMTMNDPSGRPRLELMVGQDGTPSVKLLNESGEVIRELK